MAMLPPQETKECNVAVGDLAMRALGIAHAHLLGASETWKSPTQCPALARDFQRRPQVESNVM